MVVGAPDVACLVEQLLNIMGLNIMGLNIPPC